MDLKDMVLPPMLVGLLTAVAGSTPIVRWCDVCCLWMIFGGFASACLCARNKDIEVLDGAICGAIFGVVYGVAVNAGLVFYDLAFGLLQMGAANLPPTNLLGLKLVGFPGWIILSAARFIQAILFGSIGGLIYSCSFGYDRREGTHR